MYLVSKSGYTVGFDILDDPYQSGLLFLFYMPSLKILCQINKEIIEASMS